VRRANISTSWVVEKKVGLPCSYGFGPRDSTAAWMVGIFCVWNLDSKGKERIGVGTGAKGDASSRIDSTN
jgi:hypothetical protein